MAYSHTLESIVLHSYDIGEADRFVVLFTRKKGKIVARANGVRKLKSKIGGSLLPFQHVFVEVVETRSGFLVTGSRMQKMFHAHWGSECYQGVEVLLLLTEEGEPMPDIFDVLMQLLYEHIHLLPFLLRVFHVLGVLPVLPDDQRFYNLTPKEQEYVRNCTLARDLSVLDQGYPTKPNNLSLFCERMLHDQLSRPLKSRALFTKESALKLSSRGICLKDMSGKIAESS